MHGPLISRHSGPRSPGRGPAPGAPAPSLLLALVLVLAAGCALVARPSWDGAATAAGVSGFDFHADSFAFRNDIRELHPPGADIYANYCFVLARGLRQFFQFARFDPAAPRLDHEGYVARVREVARRAVWRPALPASGRVVIPGYASLREFSSGEEAAVKRGLGPRFWTWVHWTNWRVTLPLPPGHQETVTREIMDELAAGRLVQLLVTNFPTHELNHAVVAYEFRTTAVGVDVLVWDPNDPGTPGVITFDRERRRFWATALFQTRPGPIRAFRMYHSWFL